ncbi:MAG: hypothetical protein IKT81_04260 [Clostridia bacterium]|nr:hypothetical protein [Clostridia bacterium]MBR4954720.1 hypothetical protein [Clostridia bacterium]MBR5902613.1 hypothetical protein [Clostridia bacterium]
MKKLTCLVLAIVMLFSVTIPAFAIVRPEDAAPLYPDDALFIPLDTAGQIALLFLDDMIATETTVWDENTVITDIVTLYDAQGNINAYSVEFTDGYATVSAYMDTPSIILEWSDTAAPLYDGFELEPGDKVVCLGVLDYLKDSGGNTLTDLDDNTVARASATNTLATLRSEENISQAEMAVVNAYQVNNTKPPREPAITDPFAHAESIYGGSYVCNDYINTWESYMQFSTTGDFLNLDDGYDNNCGPTAITNIIRSIANRYNILPLKNAAATSVFRTVASIGLNHTPVPYYLSEKRMINGRERVGTLRETTRDYIMDCFAYYDVQITMPYQRYSVNYVDVYNTLNDGSLLYLVVTYHPRYENHAVVAYAYTRLCSGANGNFVMYLKVADGWDNEGRYIDSASVVTGEFWEVQY